MDTAIEPHQADETADSAPVFEIHADLLPEAQRRLEKANRRLQRGGATDQFSMTVERYTLEDTNPGTGMPRLTPMARLMISAPVITAPGYTFVATLKREAGGMVVRTAPGHNLDGWARPQEHDCDYCGKSRTRTTSYVVQSTSTGEFVQIGKSCVAAFLGITPAGLWALQYDPEEFIPDNPGRDHLQTLYPIRDVLALAWTVSNEGREFVTASAVRNGYQGPSTADRTMHVWHWEPRGRNWQDEKPKIDALRAAAANVDPGLVDELVAEGLGLDQSTDYGANMHVVLSSNAITPSSLGLLVSVIAVRNRRLKQVAETKAAPLIADDWLGDPTEKTLLNDIAATITNLIEVDGYAYNSTDTLIILRTDSGHVLKWKTQGCRPELAVGQNHQILRARVKSHEEYRGTKQTVVNYVKLHPLPEEKQPK